MSILNLSSEDVSKAGEDNRTGPSKMAGIVALIRADESRKPEVERICYDPYAIRFVDTAMLELMIHYPEQFRAEMDRQNRLMPGLANSLVARVRFFDEQVKASVDDGCEQVVTLGAGYDTRAYRIEGIEKARVFEVDQQDTIRAKEEKIREIFGSLPGHVTYVPADLIAAPLGRCLGESGYDRSVKTLFVLEGLVYYLPPEAVDELFAFIAHNSGRGSVVLFDYGRVGSEKDMAGYAYAANFAKQQGEPVKSMVRGPIREFLKVRGFSLVKNMDNEDVKKAYFHGKNAGRDVSDRSSFAYAEVAGPVVQAEQEDLT